MKKNTTKMAALLMAFGLTAAACGSDTIVDEATEAVEETAEVVEEAVDGEDEAMEEEEEAMEEEAMEEEEEAMEEEAMEDLPSTVVDIATSSDDFSILVAAVTEAGLVETLQGEGPFTVFAPTNAAFEALLEEGGITAEDLLAAEDLGDILTYHVVAGEIFAADAIAADGTSVETVQGESIDIAVVDGSVVLDGIATVTAVDLAAGNGVVHVIDAVIAP